MVHFAVEQTEEGCVLRLWRLHMERLFKFKFKSQTLHLNVQANKFQEVPCLTFPPAKHTTSQKAYQRLREHPHLFQPHAILTSFLWDRTENNNPKHQYYCPYSWTDRNALRSIQHKPRPCLTELVFEMDLMHLNCESKMLRFSCCVCSYNHWKFFRLEWSQVSHSYHSNKTISHVMTTDQDAEFCCLRMNKSLLVIVGQMIP